MSTLEYQSLNQLNILTGYSGENMTKKEKLMRAAVKAHDRRLYDEQQSIMTDCGRHV